MKLFFADKFPQDYQDKLTQAGHEITFKPDIQSDEIPGVIGDHEVIIVRSTKVTKDIIDAASNLKMVIRAGAGTNTIDKTYAAEKNVPVCNCPGMNSLAVAELTLGMILSIDRNIPDNVIEMRNNVWDKKRFSKTTGIAGRSIGIIGMGMIGIAVAERAKAFGMTVWTTKKERPEWLQKRLDAVGANYGEDMYEVARNCDIVTFHVPASANTKGYINKKFLDSMQDGAMLINTSRGEIVNDDDLLAALDAKNIRAGLDVWNNEPTQGRDTIDLPLSQHPNVYGTHHIGASTTQAQDAVAQEVLNVIEDLKNGTIRNCVNM